MSWVDVGQIAVACIVSAGGIGSIIIGAVKFSANRIADRMNAKFEATLNKELEKYKAELSKKEYVSKTRFDTEFNIYRELCQIFSKAIEGVHGIIPSGEVYYPINNSERDEYEQQLFLDFARASYEAQKALLPNAPFIPKNIYNKFNEIMALIRTQSEVYNEANFTTTLSNAEGEITVEDRRRTALIDEKFDLLTDEIRTYLSTLEIMREN